jgi:hypothetical protein
VLNCFAEVLRRDVCRSIQIGDGARNFPDATVRARRKAQARHRILQQFFAIRVNRAVVELRID